MPTGRRALLLGALGVLAGCSTPGAPAPSVSGGTPSEVVIPGVPVGTTMPILDEPPTPAPARRTWAFRAMTYNTLSGARSRSAFPHVSAADLRFENRAPVLAEWIMDARPDVLALQENEPMRAPIFRPLRGLLPLLKGYAVIEADCDVPILYRSKVFREVDSGLRVLSRRRLVRNGTWARLVHKATGSEVMVANTHLDPGDSTAAKRRRATELEILTGWVAASNPHSAPVVLLGDFNARDNRRPDGRIRHLDPVYTAGLRNSADIAWESLTKVPDASTFSGLGTEVDGTWRYGAIRRTGQAIDYIWVSPEVDVRSYQVYTGPTVRTLDGAAFFGAGVVPSDHNPVVADLGLPVS